MTLNFNHAEAWALMKYRARDAADSELIWNSRDGVTPFIIRSEDREHELQHGNWRGDVVSPAHIPGVGARIFVDATIEDLVAGIAPRIWGEVGDDGSISDQLAAAFPGKTVRQIILEIANHDLTEHGVPPPHLVVVTLERQKALIETTGERVAEAVSKGWSPIRGGRYA